MGLISPKKEIYCDKMRGDTVKRASISTNGKTGTLRELLRLTKDSAKSAVHVYFEPLTHLAPTNIKTSIGKLLRADKK